MKNKTQNLESTLTNELHSHIDNKLWFLATKTFLKICSSLPPNLSIELFKASILPHLLHFPKFFILSLISDLFLSISQNEKALSLFNEIFFSFFSENDKNDENENEKEKNINKEIFSFFLTIERIHFLILQNVSNSKIVLKMNPFLLQNERMEEKIRNWKSFIGNFETEIILQRYYKLLITYFKLSGNAKLFLSFVLKYLSFEKNSNISVKRKEKDFSLLAEERKERELLERDVCIVAMTAKEFYDFSLLNDFLHSQNLTSNSQKLTSNSQNLTSNSQRLTSNSQNLTSNSQKLTSNFENLKEEKTFWKTVLIKFFEGDFNYIERFIKESNIEILKRNISLIIFRCKVFSLFYFFSSFYSKNFKLEESLKLKMILKKCNFSEEEFVFSFMFGKSNFLFDGIVDLKEGNIKLFWVKSILKEEILEKCLERFSLINLIE